MIENLDIATPFSIFNFTLPEPLNASIQGTTIPLEKAKFKLLYDENGIKSFALIAHLSDIGATELAKHFELIASAIEEDYFTYLFKLKAKLLKTHHKSLTDAISPEDYLKIEKGMCLKFESYDLISSIDFEASNMDVSSRVI